ncbi:MAG TPA: glycosyltransferase [Candidatus Paceibacterota bacterium]|jgi:glycosyltransferase involved in cell wall biosynthesis|nr:glycosyltransferase [Candidatus Paceibacterota bacterium]
MRIAIFSDNFYPELSGISDSIIALSRELIKKGHYVDFYVPMYTKGDYEAANVAFKEIDLGDHVQVIRFYSFPYKTGTGHGRFVIPTGLRTATVFKFHPDVIHTQLFFGVGLEAIMAARMLVRPVIGTNHTALKEYLKYSFIQNESFKKGLLKYMNWYYERCELVTAPSQSVFDEMVTLGFKNVKSRVISNPLDTALFHPMDDKPALKKKFGFNDTTIIHAGRLAEERSPEVLVRALTYVKKEVPGAMLAFAGSGSSMVLLQELAKALHVADSVKFMGYVSKTELNEAYNASEVFAISSTSDTQSMVMMQAMASGIPIVGVNARALPEYVNAGNGFIVPPNDEKAMAEKLIYLLKNPGVAQKLGAGARTYAEQFSEPKIADQWEAIYASVIKSYNERYHRT